MKSWRDSGKGLGSAGNNFASTTNRLMHHIADGFMWLGGSLLILLALLTVLDVCGRSFFSLPVQGTIEMVQLMLVCITFSGIVYATAKKAHVKVDIFLTRFSKRIQGILAAIMVFIEAVVCGFLSWQLGLSAEEWALSGRHSATLAMPVAPFKFVAAVAAGMVCLLLLLDFLRSLGKQP